MRLTLQFSTASLLFFTVAAAPRAEEATRDSEVHFAHQSAYGTSARTHPAAPGSHRRANDRENSDLSGSGRCGRACVRSLRLRLSPELLSRLRRAPPVALRPGVDELGRAQQFPSKFAGTRPPRQSKLPSEFVLEHHQRRSHDEHLGPLPRPPRKHARPQCPLVWNRLRSRPLLDSEPPLNPLGPTPHRNGTRIVSAHTRRFAFRFSRPTSPASLTNSRLPVKTGTSFAVGFARDSRRLGPCSRRSWWPVRV